MRTAAWLMTAALIGFCTAGGCERASDGPASPETAGERHVEQRDYPITGRVTTVAADKTAVTLDHEDIPGLMPGMEMEFTVEDPQILDEVEAGNDVQGRLKVEDGNYIITELQNQ